MIGLGHFLEFLGLPEKNYLSQLLLITLYCPQKSSPKREKEEGLLMRPLLVPRRCPSIVWCLAQRGTRIKPDWKKEARQKKSRIKAFQLIGKCSEWRTRNRTKGQKGGCRQKANRLEPFTGNLLFPCVCMSSH